MTSVLRLLFCVAAIACADNANIPCAGLPVQMISMPVGPSIRVGESFVATAGFDYDSCSGKASSPPPRQFVWSSTDSTVAMVVATDSIHARVTGVRAGAAMIVPTYRSNQRSLFPIRVTVQP